MHGIIQSLGAKGYEEVERWSISDVLFFIRRELGFKSGFVLFIQAFLACLILVGVYGLYVDVSAGADWFGDMLLPFGAGVLSMILVVVPHEFIHGIAYRLTGAKTIVYGADWKRLVFHASAPYHAIKYREMLLVALAPFVVISSIIIAGLWLTTGFWWWVLFGLFLMHTQGCLGDMAMCNFFARQDNPAQWLTYDDADEGAFVILKKNKSAASG